MDESTRAVADEVAAALTEQGDVESISLTLPRGVAEAFVSHVTQEPLGAEHEELYTSTEAAHALGLSRPTLMKLVDRGEIGFVKVGSHYRFPVEEIEAYKRLQSVSRSRATATWNELESARSAAPGSNVTFGGVR